MMSLWRHFQYTFNVRASEAATQQLPDVYKNSVESYLSIRNEQFVEKSSRL